MEPTLKEDLFQYCIFCDRDIVATTRIQELAKLKNANYIINVFVTSGPRLNIKTVFPSYGDSHVKDKTAVRTSYL